MRTSWMATMRRVVAACVCAALTLGSTAPAWAGDRPVLPGDPYPRGYYVVRLADGSDMGGQLERMDAHTLTLRPIGAASRVVPMDRVTSVERRGNRMGEGAATGGMLLGLAGLAFGTMLVHEVGGTDTDAMLFAGGGVALGALLGGSVGKGLRSVTTIYQRPGIALAPTRGGIAVSYHLALGGH